MEPEVAAPVEIAQLDRAMRAEISEATLQHLLTTRQVAALTADAIEPALWAQINHLTAPAKLAIISQLLTQLELTQVQAVIEQGTQALSARQQRQAAVASTVSPNTRLVLKKDYTYQDRGLTQPTQYYVYLRRCKPKLDRYIGTLFYLPQGCTLSYFLDSDGQIMLNPPHNIFQLRDYNDPANVQIVRLICLEPPPIDYTFTKQQKDIPAIYLHIEILHPQTHQAIAQHRLAFPACMHEGGRLDRYRWEVSTVLATPAHSALTPAPPSAGAANLGPVPIDRFDRVVVAAQSDLIPAQLNHDSDLSLAKPGRRVLELPKAKAPIFYLSDRTQAELIVKRLRLWATWSEKALPHAKWTVLAEGEDQVLLNANSQRRILKFSPDRATITLENTLQVLVKWFHDLGLAVSQTQSHRRYSVTQLQLARNLFVDMSLPQTDALQVLKKLFGVDFIFP